MHTAQSLGTTGIAVSDIGVVGCILEWPNLSLKPMILKTKNCMTLPKKNSKNKIRIINNIVYLN